MSKLYQGAAAAVGALIAYMYGGWSEMLTLLLAFVVLDYITGVLAAGKEGQLSSYAGFKGISRKIGIFALVAVAHMADKALGDGTMIRDAAIFFYIANELLSIIENAGVLGIPVPDILLRTVEILKGKSDPQ